MILHRAIIFVLALWAVPAIAQTSPSSSAATHDVEHTTGRTDLKGHQENNQMTPQGPSGPLNTTSGGAPPESPQGQSPPGMQAAPEGSSKTIVDNPKK
jgi:hypothetical protein